MELSSDIINNLGSFASIISIPITFILFIIDNTKRTSKARRRCAEKLCLRLVKDQKIDLFIVERIIDSTLIGNFFVRKKNISVSDVLSETLKVISSSLFLDDKGKENHNSIIIKLWKRDKDWINDRKRSLRHLFVYVLLVLLVFVNIDYFTEGLMLSLVKEINYSLILKIILALALIIIAIIVSVFILEIVYKDQFQGKIALESISNKLMDKMKNRYYLYNEETKQVMTFIKVTDKSYYKKRIADSGAGVFSPWGYRVVYDFEHREIQLCNHTKHFSILIHVYKTSGVNGGAIFDIASLELTYKGHKLAKIKSIIDFYKGKTMAHDPQNSIKTMYDWSTFHYKSAIYEYNGKKHNVLQNVKGKHDMIIDAKTFTPYELIINGKSWKAFERE